MVVCVKPAPATSNFADVLKKINPVLFICKTYNKRVKIVIAVEKKQGGSMFLLGDLLARAKLGAGVKSDIKLARAIGVTQPCLSMWRMGRAWPNDTAIALLCQFSGDDAALFCVQLAAFRAPNDLTRLMWESVENSLKRVRHFDALEVVAATKKIAA